VVRMRALILEAGVGDLPAYIWVSRREGERWWTGGNGCGWRVCGSL
jgi:hypothetical protein